MITCKFADIIQISKLDITYKDKNGCELSISLPQCKHNWAKLHNFADDKSNCVADRDIAATPMYFLFYSDPQVKIVFPYKKSKIALLLSMLKWSTSAEVQAHQGFYSFQKLIQEDGWSTYGLS